MEEIRVAFVGVGNCCSSLVQGLFYYKDVISNETPVPGLMHNVLGGYKISDIKPVAAFDVDKRKVGKDLSEAILSLPNNTFIFQKDIPQLEVVIQMGPVMDGVSPHMEKYPEKYSFRVADRNPVDVTQVLIDTKAEILVNYLPVGSEVATRYYAQCALDARVSFINCMPVFIVSNPKWEGKFAERNIPCIGDDIKAQLGATILHRAIARLFDERGVEIKRTYQLNTGGNTDFLNMLEAKRLKSKRESKTEAVQSILSSRLNPENIHIGPSDYVCWQKDNKICFLRIEGENFGNVPLNLECRLSVEDSPNSAGIVIDAIRCAKLALDRKVYGGLTSASAYLMKHPPEQFTDNVARQMLEEFIRGERER